MARGIVLTVLVLFVLGCSAGVPRFDHVYGTTDYSTYHGVQCQDSITFICVTSDLHISTETAQRLVAAARPHHSKYGPIVAIRREPNFSSDDGVLAVGVVSGSYSTVNGSRWGAAEEVSIFSGLGSYWIYLETVYPIYDPV